MRKILFTVADIKHDSNTELQLKASELAVLMYLKIREHDGRGPASRDELLDHLPIRERTLDAALAVLKRRELIDRKIIFEVTARGRAI